MRKILVLAAAAAAISSPALADGVWSEIWDFDNARGYGTLGYNYVDKAKTGAIQGRLGIDLSRYLAVEAEVGLGVQGHDRDILGEKARLKEPWEAAGYVVGKVPVTDNFQLLARGGYGHTEFRQTYDGSTSDVGGDHWSYGVGAQYSWDDSNGIRADWTRRQFKGSSRDNLNTYGISYVRHF